MNNIIEVYQRLCNQNSATIMPGTMVPGHDVEADALNTFMHMGADADDVEADALNTFVHMGADADDVEADAINPKDQRLEENKSKEKGNASDKGNTNDELTKAVPVADDFAKLPRRRRIYAMGAEIAQKVEFIRNEGTHYYYDHSSEICVSINPKPSPQGGNFTKIVRDNVSENHREFVNDRDSWDIYSWLVDNDDWSKEAVSFNEESLVAFENGYYDFGAGEFVWGKPHDMGKYFTTKIAATYVDAPMSPLSEDFFISTFIEEPQFILAACGVLLSNFRDFKKAFIFIGPPNSGKTTLTNFTVDSIFPSRKDKAARVDSAVRAVSLKRLGGRFSPAVLMDKHFSWNGDAGKAEFIQSSFDNFKTLTGRDEFEAENKFKPLQIEKPRCALAFNCNTFPKIPLAWDYDGTGNIDDGAGRSRFVIFHTRQRITEKMQQEYKQKHGKSVDQVLAEDRDAIASEMIRQAGRFYRGEIFFPIASFEEVYCEGKTLKERFFYLVETQCLLTGDRNDFVPLQEIVAAYKNSHPDEILPYKDAIAEERAFGALLNYVIKLDPRFVQAKRKVPGYPNPVSCLIGCRLKSRPQAGDSLNILNP